MGKSVEKIDKPPIKCKRSLRGHLGKIYALQWSNEKTKLVSASQDGKLLVWDALTTNKSHAIPLRCAWVMTCAYSPTGNFVACGGLDNICSVYSLDKETVTKPTKELNQHTGYLSCCRFIDDRQIITSSGDGTCLLWDVEAGTKVTEFKDHESDVMSVSIAPDNSKFVSSGCDNDCIVWDIKTGKAEHVFKGHEQDVNCVKFFPDGNSFGSGSDDCTCKLFDIRADRDLATYKSDKVVTSLTFSKSGRFMFTSYDDVVVRTWDVLRAEPVGDLKGHTERISCVDVSSDGYALASGSWDNQIRIWA